jgi:phenylacetate-CoA ligase
MNRESYLAYNAPRLINRISQAGSASPFYRRLLRRANKAINFGTNNPAALIDQVPYTIKDDLRRHFPKGFLMAPWEDIRAYFESSGTSDGSIQSSKSMALRTQRDGQLDIVRRVPPFLSGGAGQVAVINLPFALTSSAVSFYQALSHAGYVTVAADQGQLLSSYTRVGDLVRSLDATVLVTSDPLLLRDIVLFDTGSDLFRASKLKWIACVGVPLSRARRDSIERQFGITILPYYGLSEFGAVGVPDGEGRMRVHPDFHVEIYNPKNPEALGGEIVLWDLVSEGSPLLRYQTGDVGRVEFSEDGDQPVVYLEVFGRKSELIVDGANYLFPTHFQDLLVDLPNVSPVHRVTVEGEESLKITVDVQLYDIAQQGALDTIRQRAEKLTAIPVELVPHRFGELFPALYLQEIYKNTQSAKSLAFHDRRRGQWVVTY